MNNQIYLSKQPNARGVFFLRIIKDPDQQKMEIDEQHPPQFFPEGKPTAEGKPLDLLQVWIKPSEEPYTSVMIAEKPVIKETEYLSEKVSIELIHSQTKKIIDQTVFGYQEAFLESHIHDWSDRLKPE